jgi:probable HAF family extracellular repeat protein
MSAFSARRAFKKDRFRFLPAPLLATAVLVLGLSVQGAAAQSYKFKTINIPGSAQTSLLSDADSTIVGWNYDSSGNPTCTLIKGKTYTAISDPNGVQTYCYAISGGGKVVGYYNTSNNGAVGFTYINGIFSDFALPGISGALPIAISSDAIIAGYYYDQNSQPWGFVLKGRIVTTFQVPGAANIFPVGINSHSELTLQEIDTSGNAHCLVGTAPNFTEMMVPGATETICEDVNNNGKIVGTYIDSAGTYHGFAYDPVTLSFYTIDYPGMAGTHLRAITNVETVVGYYQATGGGAKQGLEATGSFP